MTHWQKLSVAVVENCSNLSEWVSLCNQKSQTFQIVKSSVAITTDGIHSIEDKTLNRILENTSDIKQAADRLTALSRWCGGHDNATCAIFNISEVPEALALYEGSGIRLWDAYGELTTLWLREEDQAFNCKQARPPINLDDRKEDPYGNSLPTSDVAIENKPKRKKAPTKRLKKKQEDEYSKNIELDIQIGNPEEQGDDGVNSK